jgi:hypothetical protein
MLNKINRANGIYGSTRLVVPAFSPFMLFQVNVVAQEKVKWRNLQLSTLLQIKKQTKT